MGARVNATVQRKKSESRSDYAGIIIAAIAVQWHMIVIRKIQATCSDGNNGCLGVVPVVQSWQLVLLSIVNIPLWQLAFQCEYVFGDQAPNWDVIHALLFPALRA